MPNRLFHGLYTKLLARLLTDAGAKQAAAQQIEDTINDSI